MNILIVESENDQYFIEALVNFLNQNQDSKVMVSRIDDYKHSSLDSVKLQTQISSALTERGIFKIGIILDIDNDSQENRIQLINDALAKALIENDFIDQNNDNKISNVNELISIRKDEYIEIKVACHFTNIDGEGELETLLKAIKKCDSPFADCLYEGWKLCLEKKGKKIVGAGQQGDLSHKELLKLWVDFYKRFDTLKKGKRDEYSTDWKGIWSGIPSKGKDKFVTKRGEDIFDLSSERLNDIKAFLSLFN
jgi:hypothetical protein